MEPTKATKLVQMALDQFRLGCSLDGKPFAVELDGPNIALSLRGRGGLRSALAHAYFVAEAQAPGQNPLSEALVVIEGMASAKDREPVATRMAMHDGGLVVDLARADGKAVVITETGWFVVDRGPVPCRSEALTELPLPAHGGDLEELHELVNVPKADWPVLVAFLVAALFPDLGHPILFLSGEQGSAKSWASRLVARTFDGAATDVQSQPRNLDDWSVLAAASWSIALDNVSRIDPWFSDALCRSSTGAMSLKRSLYTDDQVSVLRVKRVVILNGIDPEVAGGDLAERLIRIDLEPVSTRRTDEDMTAAFALAHPRILGALIDLAASVLRLLPTTTVPDPPRMASFAMVLVAVDRVLGTDGLARYREMVLTQIAQTSEGSVFVQAVAKLLAESGGEWTGTSSELMGALPDGHRDLPGSPQLVGSALSRAAPGSDCGGGR